MKLLLDTHVFIGPLRLVRPCFTGSDRVNLAELVAPLAAETAALAA